MTYTYLVRALFDIVAGYVLWSCGVVGCEHLCNLIIELSLRELQLVVRLDHLAHRLHAEEDAQAILH